jgi:integrase
MSRQFNQNEGENMATIQERKNADGSTSYRAIVRKTHFSGSLTFPTREQAETWAEAKEDPDVAAVVTHATAKVTKTAKETKPATAADELTLASSVRTLIRKYLAEVTAKKPSAYTEGPTLEMLMERYAVLFEKSIAAFTPDDAQYVIDTRLAGSDDWPGVSGSTVRRNCVLLSSIFNHAHKVWRLKLESPFKWVKRPPENPHRTRLCDEDETHLICYAFRYIRMTIPTTQGHYVAWSFMFARETAMRRGEILNMRRKHVDLAHKVIHLQPGETKNGFARDVPLSKKAREMLALLPAMTKGKPDDKLIPYTAVQFSNCWQAGRRRSKLENLRFHDTRHDATTKFAGKVRNVLELASITGHRRLDELLTYFNPHAHELADRLD